MVIKEDSAVDSVTKRGPESRREVRTEVNVAKVRVRMRCVPQVSIDDRDLRCPCCDRIAYMRVT